jgi:ATP-dependent DNA helicase RecG
VDSKELRELIRQGKGQRLDWHPQDVPVRTLAASLVALANADGGTVLIGLTPRAGRPQGLRDPDGLIDVALAAALKATPPLIIPLPQIAELDGRSLISITVPAGLPRVHHLDGTYLIRDGARNRPLAPRALRRLMIARGEISWEAQAPGEATLSDLDWDAVSAYAGQLERFGSISPKEILFRRGCLAKRETELVPTYAGLLLFGHDPQRWVHGAYIDAARFSGQEMNDSFVRQTIGGTLPHQLGQAEAFLMDSMSSVVDLGPGLVRVEQPRYPLEAAREALVNAVAHRDYHITGDQIRVFLFADRLEITSPGRLPGHVTVENIAEERFSRNEVIVQVLADMGFIERLGYGIKRMLRLMEEHRLPPPRFEERAGGFRVTLAGLRAPAPGSGLPLDISSELELNPRQEQALSFVLQQRRITNRDYQTLCPDVHPETLRRDLSDLVQKDLLLKIGDKRATYYILKKAG